MRQIKHLILAGSLLANAIYADFPNPLITCFTTFPNSFAVTTSGNNTVYNFGNYAAKKISNTCYNYSTGLWFDEAPALIGGQFIAYVPVTGTPNAADSAQHRTIFATLQMAKANNSLIAVDPINKTVRIQTIRTLYTWPRGHRIWNVDKSNYLGISVNMMDPRLSIKSPYPLTPTDTVGYAYAPSIVKHNSVYHMFYCSQGSGHGGDGLIDYIRHSTSTDGVNWSLAAPIISLKPNVNPALPDPVQGERCACDPSVVFNDDEQKWFLFYGGAYNGDGQIYVAKSASLDGPWQKLIGTAPGSWANSNDNISKPLAIISPKYAYSNSNGGAARPTVVFKDHKFHMWYSDQSFSSLDPKSGWRNDVQRYFYTKSKSSNGIDWEPSQEFQMKFGSNTISNHNFLTPPGEVKWEPLSKKFWFFNRADSAPFAYNQSPVIVRYAASESTPWIWSRIDTVATLTNCSHNIGVSGDHHGWIDSTKYFISAGVPWEFNDAKFPYGHWWNMFSLAIRGNFNK